MSWIKNFFANSEFSLLMDLVSPAFFKVIKPLDGLYVAKKLSQNLLDKKTFKEITSSQNLSSINLLWTEKVSDIPVNKPVDSGTAEKILELYFYQLFHGQTVILDLRHESFSTVHSSNVGVQWSPRPFYWKFSETFLEGMKTVYQGFFNDESILVDRGLKILEMLPLKNQFMHHFGNASQEKIFFKINDFKESFHRIFTKCMKDGISLHQDFIPFGIYLTLLYQTLDSCTEPLNVKKSFNHACAK